MDSPAPAAAPVDQGKTEDPPPHGQKELLEQLRSDLKRLAAETQPDRALRFFKTQPGQYAHGDQFWGIPTPQITGLAHAYGPRLSLSSLQSCLYSSFNEERHLALRILARRFRKSNLQEQTPLYAFYCTHLDQVNNWNLVDFSAPLIPGIYLEHREKSDLIHWAQSPSLWRRRVALVATWPWIKHHSFEWTLRLAHQFLSAPEDLLHKATGWMLREVGKQSQPTLEAFLNTHAATMPRTALRYALEHFSPSQRQIYLALGK